MRTRGKHDEGRQGKARRGSKTDSETGGIATTRAKQPPTVVLLGLGGCGLEFGEDGRGQARFHVLKLHQRQRTAQNTNTDEGTQRERE